MTEMPRWVFTAVLLILVIGFIAAARGDDHHHGDDVGAQPRVAQLSG